MSDSRSNPVAICVAWWRALQPGHPSGGNRPALAKLRRAASLLEAAQEPTTVQLARSLGGPEWLERAALVAAILAHVRDDDPRISCARAIGKQADGSSIVSELRFRRLMATEDTTEMLTAFRRIVALANHALNVRDLAHALLRWNDATRTRWVYTYYDAGPDAPRPTTIETKDAVA
jgi:CRISPR system Cascade subunit CasB